MAGNKGNETRITESSIHNYSAFLWCAGFKGTRNEYEGNVLFHVEK